MVTVTPRMSSALSLLSRILAICSSYRSTKVAKSRVSASLMHGTIRDRVPSSRAMSTAIPRPMCSGRTILGLPAASVA